MITKSRIVVFILAWLVWLALTGASGVQEAIAGIIVAAIVTTIAGQMVVTTKNKNSLPKRILYAITYLFVFLWEMIKANVHVAYIVLHPLLPIKPGIVKINTNLSKDTSLTLLSNSITLTPGTLTVDLHPEKKNLYIHEIEVKSKDVDENTKRVGGRFEPILKEVFE